MINLMVPQSIRCAKSRVWSINKVPLLASGDPAAPTASHHGASGDGHPFPGSLSLLPSPLGRCEEQDAGQRKAAARPNAFAPSGEHLAAEDKLRQ